MAKKASNHCIFYIGKHAELSIAELESLGIEVKKITHSLYEGVIPESINPIRLQKQLGGTIKISKIIGKTNNIEDAQETIVTEIAGKKPKNKVRFGINVEFLNKNRAQFKAINILLSDIKKRLTQFNLTSRYLNKRGQNVNNVIALKELHKEQTFIFDLIEINESGNRFFYVAQALTVQEINQYALRDYEKPFRDAKVGMLPPKLAQMMLNIATGFIPETERNEVTIFDPFCGSGTVLIEGLLNHYVVIGSDINNQMIEGSQTNIQFSAVKLNIDPRAAHVFTHDASKSFPKNVAADVIVTEGYLGTPYRHTPKNEEVRNERGLLLSLYKKFLANAHEILKKGAPLVITLPFIKTKDQVFSFKDSIAEFEKIGYKCISLNKKFPTLRYARNDQVVGREIFKFIKK